MTKYGVIVGSTRKNSFSEAVAKAIVNGLPSNSEVTFIEIDDLPLYNQDLDGNSPETYTRFRTEVKAQDAIIFVTPEHNRNIPAALKNALDIGSRPYGETVWAGKPALVASQSPSGMGGTLANHAVRQTLVFLDMPTMQQPELYIANSADSFAEDLSPTNERTKEFLENAGKAFSEFVSHFE